MANIDRSAVSSGDTVQWTTRKNTTATGLASYTTQDSVHVEIFAGHSRARYAVPWERVTGHWPGREHYDRARGALTDHADGAS